MNATPLTLLLIGGAPGPLPTALDRLCDQGALVAHRATPAQMRQVLDTLLPDVLLAPEPPLQLPPGVRWLPWQGEAEALTPLLAQVLPPRRRDGLQRLGEVVVDEAHGRISLLPHGDLPVPATEMRLLLCLGRHGGRAVSRQQLLVEVWPAHQRPQTRTVDQVVRRLRHLLHPLGLADRLQSLRGLGYRLDLPPLSPL